MLGEGIVSFGVRVTTERRNVNASTKIDLGRVTRPVMARSGRVKCRSPLLPWKGTGIVWPWLDHPPSGGGKSRGQDLRRRPPALRDRRPPLPRHSTPLGA